MPASCDATLAEWQDQSLYHVREKLMGRRESCAAIVLSASTLSRTIMSSQLKCRGWSVTPANHLSDATSILYQQISKATGRGLSVARDVDPRNGEGAHQYTSSGFRIKFADDDAVARLVLVDCFTHETLADIVKHIRLLDNDYKLNLIIVYLAMPRPTEGLGFIIAPQHEVSFADAYQSGVDLVVPSFFDRAVVEFLTELFLSSSGRYQKSGAVTATTSNFSQIRSLLLDVTDRSHAQRDRALHATDDFTGGVPNLAGFAAVSDRKGLDEDQLETEVSQKRQQELQRQEKRRKQQQAADAIDTNPEYISLLSKYEVCLRQLSANKTKMAQMHEDHEATKAALAKSEEDGQVHLVEVQRLKNLLDSINSQDDQNSKQRSSQGAYAQLVSREQRISQLEKEVAGYKSKFESTKKLADEAISKVEKFKKEAEDARRTLVNVNKRFENRLRALGVTGAVDFDKEDDKQEGLISALNTEVAKLQRQCIFWQTQRERTEACLLHVHDTDCFGKTADAIIDGFHTLMMNRDDVASLLGQKRSQQYSTPMVTSMTPAPPADGSFENASASEGGHVAPTLGGESTGSFGSVTPRTSELRSAVTVAPHDITSADAPRRRQDPDFLRAFAGVSGAQFDDMSAPAQVDDSKDRQVCDTLVLEARRAVEDGDSVITQVRQHQRQAEDNRRYNRAQSLGLSQIRAGSMFRDEKLHQRISPTEGIFNATREMEPNTASHPRLAATLTSISTVGAKMAEELEGVTTVFKSEETDTARHFTLLEAAVSDALQLSDSRPGAGLETVLSKLEENLNQKSDDVRRRLDALRADATPEGKVEYEKTVTELARLQLLLQEVEARRAVALRALDPAGSAVKKREALEKQIEAAESQVMHLLTDMFTTYDYDAYLKAQMNILAMKRDAKALPGGKPQSSRPSPAQLLLSAATAMQRRTISPVAKDSGVPEPVLSLTDVVERNVKAELAAGKATRMIAASTLQKKTSAMNFEMQQLLVIAQEAQQQCLTIPMETRPLTSGSLNGTLGTSMTIDASFETDGVSGKTGAPHVTMQSVTHDMLQRFKAYQVPPKQQPALGSLKSAAQAVKDVIHQGASEGPSADDPLPSQTFAQNMRSFSELDLSAAEAIFEKSKEVSTPTAFYQLVLLYHKDLVRLLKQLKRRTPMTSVNILDAHQLQRQLLKEGRALTKSQAENIPFLLAVDAAQIARFADYFEKETEALLREGIARLQRYVDEAAAREQGTDPIPRSAQHQALQVPGKLGRSNSSSTPLRSPQDAALLDVSHRRSTDGSASPAALQLSDDFAQDIFLPVPTVDLSHPKELTEEAGVPVTATVSALPTSSAETRSLPLPSHALSTPRPTHEEIKLSTAELMATFATHPPPINQDRRPLQHRGLCSGGATSPRPVGFVGSVLSFGAPTAVHIEMSDVSHRVIHVPRTPCADYKTNSVRRFAQPPSYDAARTAKQKSIQDVVDQLTGFTSSEHANGCHGHFAAKVPPPSRQKLLSQQAQRPPQ